MAGGRRRATARFGRGSQGLSRPRRPVRRPVESGQTAPSRHRRPTAHVRHRPARPTHPHGDRQTRHLRGHGVGGTAAPGVGRRGAVRDRSIGHDSVRSERGRLRRPRRALRTRQAAHRGSAPAGHARAAPRADDAREPEPNRVRREAPSDHRSLQPRLQEHRGVLRGAQGAGEFNERRGSAGGTAGTFRGGTRRVRPPHQTRPDPDQGAGGDGQEGRPGPRLQAQVRPPRARLEAAPGDPGSREGRHRRDARQVPTRRVRPGAVRPQVRRRVRARVLGL